MDKVFQNLCGYGVQFFRHHIPQINQKLIAQKQIFYYKTINKCFTSQTIMSEIKIATHDGKFHCDEILACFMLQTLPKYKTAQIIRTRDESVISTCDIVVDVGSIFDVEKNRFDHHQKTFESTLSSLRPELGDKWTIRLSSAGLIYTYFGEQVIDEILKQNSIILPENIRQKIYLKVYENFLLEIDAIDNGVPMFDGEPLYRIHTCLSSRVGNFNCDWNSDPNTYNAQEQFEKAKAMVGNEFTDKVIYYAKSWWQAREIVQNAVDKRFDVHNSGEIFELEKQCPWKDHLNEIEHEMNINGQLKYVLFQDKPDDYRVMCVPIEPKSFVCRKFLHSSYRGLRNEELQTVSGVADAKFCHASGFIGGAKSRDGALQMGINTLEADED